MPFSRWHREEGMTRYPCPVCRTEADLASGCPGCGRGPDPVAAEVVRLNGEIAELTARAERARQAHAEALRTLRGTQLWRNQLAARITAAVHAEEPPAPLPPAATAAAPEASVRTVQNLLFILGGLLLGTAAIVFTAVAWATFGVGGRAVILAVVTGLALAAPVLAVRRGLTATAETFAAVGLLLVVLDGYAAWYVNLFGLAAGSATRYAALVCAVTAAVAAGYAAATGLLGPRFAALVAAQPVLPLLAVDRGFGLAGCAGVAVGVATLNLLIAWSGRGGTAVRAAARALYGASLAGAVVAGVGALALPGPLADVVRSGVALVATGVALLAGSWVTRSGWFRGTAAAVLVVQVAAAADRILTVAWPARALVLAAAVAAGRAIAVRALPVAVGSGARVGGIVVGGTVALVVTGFTLAGWVRWLVIREVSFDWQLPAAAALVTAAFAVLLPRRHDPVVAGVTVLVVGLPAAWPVAWPALVAVPVVAMALASLAAAVAGSLAPCVVRAAAAAVLAVHAVTVSLFWPAATAAVLGAVTALGVAVAATARGRCTVVIGAVALGAGLFACPFAVERGLAAAGVVPWWTARAALAATAVLVPALAAVARWWPEYRRGVLVALLGAAVLTSWPPPGEPLGGYAAVGLLLVAAGARVSTTDRWAPVVAAVVLAAPLAVDVAPSLWAVFGAPYGWLGAVWTGAPDGTGVSPSARWGAGTADAVALGVATASAVTGGRRFSWGLPTGCAAVVVGLAAAAVPWPAVAAASLLLGLAVGFASGVLPGRAAAVGVPLSVVLAGAGLAGAAPTETATLAALGLTVVVSAAAGAVGRTAAARVVAWLVSVLAAVLFAVAAVLAADFTVRVAAFGVLGTAAVALALSAALRTRRRPETRALESAAHAAAVVALVLTVGSARYAAGIATLWGIAVGLRALDASGATGRRVRSAAAAGCELFAWWMLLVAAEVALVEAYTLPAAAVALLAGWLALRSRPAMSSWVAFGPALAAALLPSLASVLVAEGEPMRRLLLGVGGLAAVVAGAVWRRQAPVVVGGAVLVLLALHELVLVWDLLPRWIPLAAGGLLLVGLAMTYERRRRDVTRLRTAVGRMS